MDPVRVGAPRRSFPWWGVVPVALPWVWFAVRDHEAPFDLLAVALPGIGIAALVIAALCFSFRWWVAGATAVSLLAVCLTATLVPRIPQRTPAPSVPIRIASANVYLLNPDPGGAVEALTSRNADIIVAVEMGPKMWDTLSTHAAAYPYGVESGDQGIRSRWPLTRLPTPDNLPSNRVLRVAVEIQGVRFVMYAVHLLNPLHEISFGEQRALVTNLLADVQTEPDPTVVVGDMNMSDRSASYRMVDARMRDAMRGGTWAASTYIHNLWRLLMLRIDHLFIPEYWCTAGPRTFRVPGSDHRGIQATVGPCP